MNKDWLIINNMVRYGLKSVRSKTIMNNVYKSKLNAKKMANKWNTIFKINKIKERIKVIKL